MGIALTLATVMGLMGFFGIGHFYLRRVKRGAIWFPVGALTLLAYWMTAQSQPMRNIPWVGPLMLIAGVTLWAVHTVDAYRLVAGGLPSILPASNSVLSLARINSLSLFLLFVPVGITAAFASVTRNASLDSLRGAYVVACVLAVGSLAALLRWSPSRLMLWRGVGQGLLISAWVHWDVSWG